MPLLALRAIQSEAAKGLAALLKLPENNVYAIAQAGEIPIFKRQRCVHRTELDQWVDAQPHVWDGDSRGE